MDTLARLMHGVLEQSSRANNDLVDYYKPIRKDVRGRTIEIQRDSPAYYELLDRFGDGEGGHGWGEVRRNTFGRVNLKLVDGPGNWDTQFTELSQEYPDIFDAEAGAAENVEQALRLYEAETVYENPYGMDLDTAAENAAQELFEAYMDVSYHSSHIPTQPSARTRQK